MAGAAKKPNAMHLNASDLLLDLPGWILMAITFAIPLLFSKVRRSDPLILAIWFTLGLHHSASIVNCYLFLLPGAEEDARAMNATAMGAEYTHLKVNPYVQSLAVLYQALGKSNLLGCEISVLAYCLSVIILVYIIDWLGAGRYQVPMVLLFGSLPGAVFNCSVTLREPFQMLAILAVTWFIIRIRERDYASILGLLVSIALLSKLHNGLAIFSLVLTLLAILWGLRSHPSLALAIVIAFSLILVTQRTVVMGLVGQHSAAMGSLTRGELLKEAASYRTFQAEDRATYRAHLDTSSLWGFLTTFPKVFFLYMFSPLPWQVRGLKDLYALAESLLRMALCLGATFQLARERDAEVRSRLILILVVFFLLEAIWSVGTGNWGQAIRHRVVGWGFLVVAGAGPILAMASTERSSRAVSPPAPAGIRATN